MPETRNSADVSESKIFKEDKKTSPDGKNASLSTLLSDLWKPLNIVKIERIEIGSKAGWQATYRD